MLLSRKGKGLLLVPENVEEKDFCTRNYKEKKGGYYAPLKDHIFLARNTSLKYGEGVQDLKTSLLPIKDVPRTEKKRDRYDKLPSFPHQEEYQTLHSSKNKVLCAMSPGTGKSSCGLLRARTLSEGGRIVICAPVITLDNWENEIEQVLGEKVYIHNGPKRDTGKLSSPIVVLNYEMLEEALPFLGGIDQVILDEVHLVARPGTAKGKAVRELVRSTRGGIQGLSGTPIFSSPGGDLWEVVNMISPELAGRKGDWLDRYQEVLEYREVEYRGRVIQVPAPGSIRYKNLEGLRRQIAPILYTVRKEDVLSIGNRQVLTEVSVLPRQKELYETVRKGIRTDLGEGILTDLSFLTRWLRLMQIAECPRIVDPSLGLGPKIGLLRERFSREHEPTVLWTRSREMALLLYEEFRDKAVLFTGKENRSDKLLAQFAFDGVHSHVQERQYWEASKRGGKNYAPPGTKDLFIGVLGPTCSIGINLCHRSRHTIYTSVHGNPSTNGQAADRVYRIGQERDCTTEYLVTEGTLDVSYTREVLDRGRRNDDIIYGTGRDEDQGDIVTYKKWILEDVQ